MLARDILAEQDEEYQKCLLQDQLQEEIEKQKQNYEAQNDSEDDTKEEDYQLSPSSLRLARLRYFEKPMEVKRCECITKKGIQCLNRADIRAGMPGNICFIHYKSNKKSSINMLRM